MRKKGQNKILDFDNKNNEIETLQSQSSFQNKNINIKIAPEAIPNAKQYYTKREDISKIINKIMKNNLCDKNILNHNTYTNFYPKSPNKCYVNKINQYQNYFNSTPILEQQLKQIKLDYIALNNDNIIFREDINKLIEMNKNLEKDLSEERNHNYELAKENDKLNNDNQNLFKKIEEINQRITKIKLISQNEKDVVDRQIYFEEKINEKDLQCKKILDENNQLNIEYNLLNEKFNKLKEKNNEEENELAILKSVQEQKISEIEKKLGQLIGEMNKLKNENNDLKIKNENLRKSIANNDRERNDYYNRYQEQKRKNISINNEIQGVKQKYEEYKRKFEKKEEKKVMKDNLRKNRSEKKIKVIKDLQKRIQDYKMKRAKNQVDE